jgi:hypothetical protein
MPGVGTFYYAFKRELLKNGKRIRDKKLEAAEPRDYQ